jgi:hypothetical protein
VSQTSQKLAQEYELKAAYLERFTRFIDWPENNDIYNQNEAFCITILGDNPFGDLLNKLYSKQKVKDKKVILKYISNIDDLGHCDLLFIAPSAKSQVKKILKVLGNKPVLTIAQSSGLAAQGIMINLYIEDETIKFEINEKAIKKTGMQVRHLLLQKAKLVNTSGEDK